MKLSFSPLGKPVRILGSVLAFQLALAAAMSLAQEEPAAKPAAQAATNEDESGDATEKEGEEPDPFAFAADASVADLIKFIDKTKRMTPPKRDAKSVSEFARKLFPAIIAAADAILAQSDADEDQAKALTEKFAAYGILSRYHPPASQDLKELAAKYAEDARPAIAKIAVGHNLSSKASSIRSVTEQEAKDLAAEVLSYLERFGLDKATYSTTSSVARSLGYKHSEIAANLYEAMVPYFEKSDDQALRERAESTMGAARRLRLLGNTMELQGLTADGKEFDWSIYKGKVVLVDFWASWCGPCLGELPNMKKNLELYGEKGFDIVGINMDSTRAAFEKCVNDRDIPWANIVCEEEGKTGWSAPMATYYGVTAIPTAILVNQEGKVVSLAARGRELDKALAELLGPPEEPTKPTVEDGAEVATEDK